MGWDIRNQQLFYSKIDVLFKKMIKIMPTMQTCFLDDPNDRKYEKVIQNGVRRETQNPSKIIQNPSWDLAGFL